MSGPTLIIRNGTIVDGSGNAPYLADIAITGGLITAIGQIAETSDNEIDATGKLVTPGFIDVHTHYDAQVTWGSHLSPTSWNGVTTVLIGNCGVGFAPCKPEQRDMLVELMEGVEDIPEVVLTAGLPWNWETFPQFLDAIDARKYDCDVATQVPHAAIRVYVMGERGADREPATEADRNEMARLTVEGIRAGALGFSTSRTIAHKTLAGKPTPTLNAAEIELSTIGAAIGATEKGWMQVISDFDEPEEEFAILRRINAAAGLPMTISLLQRESRPQLWRQILDNIEEANADGQKIIGQVMARPIGVMLGFEISQNPFLQRPSYVEIANLPFEQKIAALRDPVRRARILAEETPDAVARHRLNTWDKIFQLHDPVDYEPAPEASCGATAARLGRNPQDLCYDWLLERDGHAVLYRPLINYADNDLGAVLQMMRHKDTILGLGDGGAHVSIICDASSHTYMITHWTRDRTRGEKLPIEWVVKRITRDNAMAVGLSDRGLLAPGLKADINVIDHATLRVHAPEVRYDLPAGGRRLVQQTSGFDATIVSGKATYRHGQATGELPGRLVRGTR